MYTHDHDDEIPFDIARDKGGGPRYRLYDLVGPYVGEEEIWNVRWHGDKSSIWTCPTVIDQTGMLFYFARGFVVIYELQRSL